MKPTKEEKTSTSSLRNVTLEYSEDYWYRHLASKKVYFVDQLTKR